MNLFRKLLNKIKTTEATINNLPNCVHFSDKSHTDFLRVSGNLENGKVNVLGKTILNAHLILDGTLPTINIGKNTFIGNSKIICKEEITIGESVWISYDCTIMDHDGHNIDYKLRQIDFENLYKAMNEGNGAKHKNWDVVTSKPIIIGDNAWVGAGTTILKGVTIGEGAIIGAGSVVTKDIEPYSFAAGNPAKKIKML